MCARPTCVLHHRSFCDVLAEICRRKCTVKQFVVIVVAAVAVAVVLPLFLFIVLVLVVVLGRSSLHLKCVISDIVADDKVPVRSDGIKYHTINRVNMLQCSSGGATETLSPSSAT
ncbi:unnamed protein product [Polarella glacialis]|uniref:Uncharacterized protein n=1 Tax=Polarella glacialis TaxID=89957 RepID=A0A813FPH5_POLGL|nr:unnamed protein product [Polarella glacialis]